MVSVSIAIRETAICPAVRPASEKTSPVRTDSDDTDWFKSAARQLLGSDPGLALHVLTGISESSGYRYARGERPMPLPEFRQLVWSDQGRQWFWALMDGCQAEWWLEMQRECRVGAAAIRADRQD